MSRFARVHGKKLPGGVYKVLNRQVGKAQQAYDMIQDGDRVAVGISGGKDSFTLMWILQERLSRIPVKYHLQGIHIDPGFDDTSATEIARYCEEMGYPLRVEKTDFGLKAHSEENRENPCFLCSRLRRQRLFELAQEMGCPKIALGHHKDDLIETLFLNMCYTGEIATMKPLQEFFGGEMTVIRPLAYTDEKTISTFARAMNMPEIKNACPSSGVSKRAEIKQLLEGLYKQNPKIRGNLFRSMSRVKTDYLLK
ncbi:MAG: tRNA 2-thiocytidine(32) synthetase TtcA [Desulfatibacillum sp.]|nr:tRNA 2-thiocytidine(32) synthetase TtcA [Desulfatibacillum sp.]